MKVAYINKGKVKSKSEDDEVLERAYSKDIHMSYVKNKEQERELGISEVDFVARCKKAFNIKRGLYCQ